MFRLTKIESIVFEFYARFNPQEVKDLINRMRIRRIKANGRIHD